MKCGGVGWECFKTMMGKGDLPQSRGWDKYGKLAKVSRQKWYKDTSFYTPLCHLKFCLVSSYYEIENKIVAEKRS